MRATICEHAAGGDAPLLTVSREAVESPGDVEWRLLCGERGHDPRDLVVRPLVEVVRRDPTVLAVVLRPRGTTLVRSGRDAPWRTAEGPVPLPHRASHRWPDLEPRFAPRAGEPVEEGDLKLLSDVAEWGWHVVVVISPAGQPAYAFTVGLFRSFDHPEVVLFGLEPGDLHAALNEVGERVRRGLRFEDGDEAEGVLQDRPVRFRPVSPRNFREYLGYALWYHGGARFPALQAFWPDGDGRYPWERWCSAEPRAAQPLLHEREGA